MRNLGGGASGARRRSGTRRLSEPGASGLRPRTTRPNIAFGATDRQYRPAADRQHGASADWRLVDAQQHNAGIESDRSECDQSK
jgi:hypothetical protein